MLIKSAQNAFKVAEILNFPWREFSFSLDFAQKRVKVSSPLFKVEIFGRVHNTHNNVFN